MALRFNKLETIAGISPNETAREQVRDELARAVRTLHVFEPDKPALTVFLSRMLGRAGRRATQTRARN